MARAGVLRARASPASGSGDGTPGCRRRALPFPVQRRHPHRLPDERGRGRRAGSGVQIALRLDAPGLAALPWEALFDSRDAGVPLPQGAARAARAGAATRRRRSAVTPPLRILGMVSSPSGLPALDVEAERERLEEALRPHIEAGRVELHWLDDVTWTGVHDRLLEGEWHVLHFIGHGGYDTETDEGVLAFVGRERPRRLRVGSRLADLLDEAEPTPRLVVLNSCQSGAAGTVDLFSGTAAALAHSGIHAVAAMQYSISDEPRSRSPAASTRRSRTGAASTRRCAAAASASSG